MGTTVLVLPGRWPHNPPGQHRRALCTYGLLSQHKEGRRFNGAPLLLLDMLLALGLQIV